jgi:hypothetical protein
MKFCHLQVNGWTGEHHLKWCSENQRLHVFSHIWHIDSTKIQAILGKTGYTKGRSHSWNHQKKGTRGERRKTEGINQFMLKYIYGWRCHNENTPRSFLKQMEMKMPFFLQKERTGRQNRSCFGWSTSERGRI